MATTPTRVRLHDFLLNPEIDERRLELIDGAVTEKPLPQWGHGKLAMRLAARLEEFGDASIEPRAVIPAANASPIPDVAFYRSGGPEWDAHMSEPPHVAIEILSPGQAVGYLRRKAALYFSFGVESAWLIDPVQERVIILEGDQERTLRQGDVITSTAVPGFAYPIAELFSRTRTNR